MIEAGADVLVAGTATFRGGPDRLCGQYQGAEGVSLLERVESETGEQRDRAGQEADPGRRRPRPLAVRAAELPAPPLRLADAAARAAAARPGAAEADRGAQGSDRRRQGGGRGAARRPLPPRRHRDRRSTSFDFADARPAARISATICRASPGCATSPPPRPASAAPSSPRRSCANGSPSMPSRSASRPGAPICGAAASSSGPPMRPTSCRAPTRSTAPRVLYALARGARHLERSADKAPARPPPDHRLERRDRRRSGRPGRAGAAEIGRGGPRRARSALSLHDDGGLVSRSPTEQLAAGRDARASCAPSMPPARRDVPEWLTEALASAVGALLAVTLGDDALSSWQGGNMASRRRVAAAVEGAGLDVRPLRQARGWGYQRLQAKASVLVFDAAPPPPPRALDGACASTLAFELSDGPSRLIVNCGGAGEAQGRAAGRPGPCAAHHRRPFDADPGRPQLDRDPRGRLARQGRRRGRAGRATRPPASAGSRRAMTAMSAASA